MEVARVEAVRVVEASAQEAAAARVSTTAVVRDAEDRATLAEREAWERVSMVEVHQSWDKAKEKSWGLTNAVADTERRLEESKRECQE
jgi:hypothetical protein